MSSSEAPNPSSAQATNEAAPADGTRLGKVDHWMADHPWHPRVAPEFVYLLLLVVVGELRDLNLAALAAVYTGQCVLVVWLMWRYRGLLPELNWKFHWSAIPTGVGLVVAWVYLGDWMASLRGEAWSPQELQWNPIADAENDIEKLLAQLNLGLRLLGMSLVVPMFEELFNRSLLARSFSRLRPTGIGFFQFLHDLPVIGDLVGDRSLTRKAMKHENVFGDQFEQNRLGDITALGIAISTAVFMLAHHPRDYLGCILCGVVWCVMAKYTNRGEKKLGLGPVIWSHAITNALLWVWAVYGFDGTGNWHYL